MNMDSESRLFLVRVNADLLESLRQGKARMAWSYKDNLDLREIRAKLNAGQQLESDEQESWKCHGFLERVRPGDYLLYANQPRYGWFCIVQVKQDPGEYQYAPPEDAIAGDCRSYWHCSLLTPEGIRKKDAIVPALIRYRLGNPRRFCEISHEGEFARLLERVDQAGLGEAGPGAGFTDIIADLSNVLPGLIHKHFPQQDLSRKYARALFEGMGYQCEVREGPAEAGTDLTLGIDDPLIEDEFTVGVQVFSFGGSVEEISLQTKLNQLLAGWEHNSLDYGVLFTTGTCNEDARETVEKHNREDPDRKVRLIDAPRLARLFLRNIDSVTKLAEKD